jgi:carbamoyltransferase
MNTISGRQTERSVAITQLHIPNQQYDETQQNMTKTQGVRWYLGLGGSNHDFSAALMCGNDLRVVIEQERLSRRKHGMTEWFGDPLRLAIEYCLAAESLSMVDVDRIVGSDTLPHHLCHAASAYLMLPPGTRAAVLVYDGYGSARETTPPREFRETRETFSFFTFNSGGYSCLGETFGSAFIERDEFPVGVSNSLGMLYEVVTATLGFSPMESGKTMGLSSHGSPVYVSDLEAFIQYGDSASACFSCDAANPDLIAVLEGILLRGRGSFGVRADIAASIQAIFHKVLANCIRFFDTKGIDCICLAGGCALNTVANSFLAKHLGNNVPVLVPPHCGDTGLGLGALWLDRFTDEQRAPSITFRGANVTPSLGRPGRRYTLKECRDAVGAYYPRLVHDTSINLPKDLARLLANGQIIGVLNGGSEIGPRALGGRSLFADPRTTSNRERINRHIKRREPFRPLAPIVLRSMFDRYFVGKNFADPFMLKVAQATERCVREAPAIVHVDGTARVQVVADDGDPFLVALLHAFHTLTGTGLLINTSFNRQGEPIVESPMDAIEACLGMGLDGVFLEGSYYYPSDAPAHEPPNWSVAKRVSANYRSSKNDDRG